MLTIELKIKEGKTTKTITRQATEQQLRAFRSIHGKDNVKLLTKFTSYHNNSNNVVLN